MATTRGAGHFLAVAPFGAALIAGGHELLATVPADCAALARSAGFETRVLEDVTLAQVRDVFAAGRLQPPADARRMLVRELYGRLHVPVALPTMRAAIEE